MQPKTKKIAAGLGLGLLVALLLLLFFLSRQEDTVFQERRLRYSFTVRNTTAKVLPLVKLHSYAPLTSSGQIGGEVTASHGVELVSDPLGRRVATITFTNLPPFATKVVNVTAVASLADKPRRAKIDEKVWLKPQPLAESEAPQIAKQAATLQKEDELATAHAIYDFVAGHLNYSGYSGREKSALTALQDKAGDCSEYAALFVALARAAGIPARIMGGYVAQRDRLVHATDYHNWAEFHTGGRWLIADPQQKRFNEEAQGYIAMEIVSGDKTLNAMQGNHRFRLEGVGAKVTMQ